MFRGGDSDCLEQIIPNVLRSYYRLHCKYKYFFDARRKKRNNFVFSVFKASHHSSHKGAENTRSPNTPSHHGVRGHYTLAKYTLTPTSVLGTDARQKSNKNGTNNGEPEDKKKSESAGMRIRSLIVFISTR